jgi:hypothetical protein
VNRHAREQQRSRQKAASTITVTCKSHGRVADVNSTAARLPTVASLGRQAEDLAASSAENKKSSFCHYNVSFFAVAIASHFARGAVQCKAWFIYYVIYRYFRVLAFSQSPSYPHARHNGYGCGWDCAHVL